MWLSDTVSERNRARPGGGANPGGPRAFPPGVRPGRMLLIFGIFVAMAGTVSGQTSREEVLADVYPGAVFEAERVFLSVDQQTTAARQSSVTVPSRLIARYVLRRDGEVVGRAYVDTHVVRTKNQSLLVCLNPDGSVRRVEVTSFGEPREYMGSELWYTQYQGRVLGPDLAIDRAIRPIVGATLTGRATAEAVRRVLAIDAVLGGNAP